MESCYGDLRQLNDAMARAAGTPPRTKSLFEALEIDREE